MEMPVLVPLPVTLPLKLMVLVLPPAIVTAVAVFACEIAPPHVTVPEVPETLNVAPVAPVSVPLVAPHVPVTPVSVTPFVPPVELTVLNVPLTTPVVRLRAVAPLTFTALPEMAKVPNVVPLIAAVVGGVVLPIERPASVIVDVPSVFSEMPVAPPSMVPPLTLT